MNGIVTSVSSLSFTNLLDNSNFLDPVNQRGQESYFGKVFGIDRWYGRTKDMTVEVLDSGVRLTSTNIAYAGIKQQITRIEKYRLKHLTFAVCLESSAKILVGFCDETDTKVVETQDNRIGLRTIVCSCVVPADATPTTFIPRICVRTDAPNDSAILKWAAIYEGDFSEATIPSYVPKGYEVESSICQKYFLRLTTKSTYGTVFNGNITDGGKDLVVNFFYPFIPTNPKINFSGPIIVRGISGYCSDATNTNRYNNPAVKIYKSNENFVSTLEFNKTDSSVWANVPNNTPITVSLVGNCVLEITE